MSYELRLWFFVILNEILWNGDSIEKVKDWFKLNNEDFNKFYSSYYPNICKSW